MIDDRTITLTANEITALEYARNICLARQRDHISLGAAVSVLTSVLRRVKPPGDDPPVEVRAGDP